MWSVAANWRYHACFAVYFSRPIMTFTSPLHAALDELAVVSMAGADACSFLHGQLTQDVQNLKPGQASLAGYCTAKGRLLATCVIWQAQADAYLALVRADLADALVKRLRMFVLRAKVSITRSPLQVWGLALPALPAPMAGAAWQVRATGNTWCITAPDNQTQTQTQTQAAGRPDGIQRCWYVAHAIQPPSGATQPGWANHWRVRDVQAGLPWVQAATQERFIPQTLNLDLIGGVSFTKGCYPGQEVVARSRYRGTLKRRMAAGTCTAAVEHAEWLSADADIFDANHPEQPWGRIVNVAIVQNTAWLLFEAQLNNLGEADLRLGHPQGAAITLHPLPYALTMES